LAQRHTDRLKDTLLRDVVASVGQVNAGYLEWQEIPGEDY